MMKRKRIMELWRKILLLWKKEGYPKYYHEFLRQERARERKGLRIGQAFKFGERGVLTVV